MSTDPPLALHVRCYSGYRGEESPRFICFGSSEVRVIEILDRWLAPDHRYFKCLGDDRGTYIIRYDTGERGWELVFFKSGSSE